MNKEQLKPCPFCGSSNVGNGHTAVWWASCYSCGADGPTADTELKAAEQWNHAPRASDVAALREQSDKARAVLLQSGEPDVEDLSELADDVMRRQSRLDDAFDEIKEALGCERDETEMLVAIRGLQDDNAALRLRVVPEVVWNGMLAEVGGFVLEARSGSVGWSWAIWRNGAIVSNGGGMTGVAGEQAKSACEAAFLRLVGCGNG